MQLNGRPLDLIRWIIDAGNVQKSKVIKEELDKSDISSALDMGCGLGLWADMFLGMGCYMGIDLDAEAIDYAKSRHSTQFEVMNATNLKFLDNSFTVVLISDLFHHLDDGAVKKAFAEAKRVVRAKRHLFPNAGKIIVIDSVRSKNLIQRLIMSFDAGKHIRSSEELGKLLNLKPIKEFDSGLYREALFVFDKNA